MVSDKKLIYYVTDSGLQNYITAILKNNIINKYLTDGNNIIGYTLTSPLEKNYLHGLSYQLPWPYFIGKVEFMNIEANKESILKIMEGRFS